MSQPTGNLFANIPAQLPEELFESLLENRHLRLERIVSRGHRCEPGDWFDQDRDEWVVLLKGAAQVLYAGQAEPIELKPGDFLHISAHQRHRVTWTDPDRESVWLALHYQKE